jgi:hypothetical protein
MLASAARRAYSGDRDRHFRHRDRRFRFIVTAVSG